MTDDEMRDVIAERKEGFRRRTEDKLRMCANWIDAHTDELTDRFVSDGIGTTSWSIKFVCDFERAPIPVVEVESGGHAFVCDPWTCDVTDDASGAQGQ